MRHRILLMRVAVLAALALLLTACPEARDDDAAAPADDGDDVADGGNGDEGDCPPPDTGWEDDEIRIGGIYPLSGPASAYGVIPDGATPYFEMLNEEEDGIDGRDINFIVYDDGYEPSRSVEEARRLVEQDEVFALFNTLGTPPTEAIQPYVNEQEVPHAFVATGASQWGLRMDEFPWTIGWQPDYVSEMRLYVNQLNEQMPDATVAILWQNDDFGEDTINGFRNAIEESDSNLEIVAEETYEVTDPTIDAQMRSLAGTDADVFLNITTPAFGAQALNAFRELDWDPLHIINNVSSATTVLEQVGFDLVNELNLWTMSYFMDPSSPEYEGEPAMEEYNRILEEYGDPAQSDDPFVAYGMAAAQSLEWVLRNQECPTRESFMDTVRNIPDVDIPLFLEGVTLSTSDEEEDYFPIQTMYLMEWEDGAWVESVGPVDAREEFGPHPEQQ